MPGKIRSWAVTDVVRTGILSRDPVSVRVSPPARRNGRRTGVLSWTLFFESCAISDPAGLASAGAAAAAEEDLTGTGSEGAGESVSDFNNPDVATSPLKWGTQGLPTFATKAPEPFGSPMVGDSAPDHRGRTIMGAKIPRVGTPRLSTPKLPARRINASTPKVRIPPLPWPTSPAPPSRACRSPFSPPTPTARLIPPLLPPLLPSRSARSATGRASAPLPAAPPHAMSSCRITLRGRRWARRRSLPRSSWGPRGRGPAGSVGGSRPPARGRRSPRGGRGPRRAASPRRARCPRPRARRRPSGAPRRPRSRPRPAPRPSPPAPPAPPSAGAT